MEIFVAFVYFIVVSTAQVVDKASFSVRDQFTVTCDVAKFTGNLPSATNSPYVTQLNMQRKVSTDENFVDIATYSPFVAPDDQALRNIPLGKSWDIQFSGGAGFNNRDTIKIVMISNNSSCNDTGLYRCVAIFNRDSNQYSTPNFSLTASAPITQNDIVMVPHNEQEGGDTYTSYNHVGQKVTMTCSYTGPPNLQTVWKYATKGSILELNYPVANDITESTPQIASTSSGCVSYSYISTLAFQLKEMDDGNTYYCTVILNGVEQSKRNFTISVDQIQIIQNDIIMTPQRGNVNPYSSLNKIGENITLTCNYSGPSNVRSVWKFAKNGSKTEEMYPDTNDISESTPKLTSTTTSVYALYSYTSVLAFQLQQVNDSNTYYCIVMADGVARSRRNFTIGVYQNISNNTTSLPNSACFPGVFMKIIVVLSAAVIVWI